MDTQQVSIMSVFHKQKGSGFKGSEQIMLGGKLQRLLYIARCYFDSQGLKTDITSCSLFGGA